MTAVSGVSAKTRAPFKSQSKPASSIRAKGRSGSQPNTSNGPQPSAAAIGETAVEKATNVIDELLPPPRRHIGRRSIGIQTGEARGPCARCRRTVLDQGGALLPLIS